MLQNVFNQVTDSQLSTSPACRIHDSWEDELDFRCSTAWLIFMSTLFFLVVRNGLFDLRNLVGCVIGNSTIWYKLCD
ncbi:unnamed protein product, partial [Mesorhabditis belari]|uniref:Uncharacterized protein n=1 Tax=Mesorhabditis belari TaxID=2138241 RepID=A0AAF3EJC2_9BILA